MALPIKAHSEQPSLSRFQVWMYRWTQKHIHWFFVAPSLIAILLVAIYPIVYSTGLSFFRVSFDSRERPFVLFENFLWILRDSDYRVALGNTLLYVVVTVSGSFVIGFGLALLLRRITVGRTWIRLLLILPLTIAPMVVGLTWNWMFDPLFGLVNWFFTGLGVPPQTWLAKTGTARIVVMLVDIWQWYPLVFLIMDAGLASLPKAPYEAAHLEGASEWMIFRRITLPLMRSVILVALLLRTVDAFRTFDLVRVMTDGGPAQTTETLSLYLYRTAFNFNKLSRAGAGATIMLIVISIISAFMFRFLYREQEGR
jgi:multiple sugar transport system permease protein